MCANIQKLKKMAKAYMYLLCFLVLFSVSCSPEQMSKEQAVPSVTSMSHFRSSWRHSMEADFLATNTPAITMTGRHNLEGGFVPKTITTPKFTFRGVGKN